MIILEAIGAFAVFSILLVAGCCSLAVSDSEMIRLHPPDDIGEGEQNESQRS